MQTLVVVVPCYNEAKRLDEREFLPLVARAEVDVLFVDDGSTDETLELLRSIAARCPARMRVLALRRNGGKAEAVRRGMLQALNEGAHIAGYMDADASTRAPELLRLLDEMQVRAADVALGARVQLLGSDVRRRRARHYLGRIFATAASLMLELPVYDTQCGAKLFRDTPALRLALATPFVSRWAFDVELLGRLLTGDARTPATPRERLLEVPLREWCDVAGSKLAMLSMAKSGLELVAIGARLRHIRRNRR